MLEQARHDHRLTTWRSARAVMLVLLLALAAGLAMTAPARAATCPCTLFDASSAPAGTAAEDSPLEVGVRLQSDEDGYITALRFYKQANNTGTHVGHLWSSSGVQLAEATFTNETASGWQEVELTTPVPITAGETYVASYHSSAGRYAYTPQGFAAGLDNAPLHAPADSLAAGNGVYGYGATSTFPTQSFNASNYWVDAVFRQTLPADETPPTVTAVAPADGATDVDRDGDVSASFSEDLDADTVTAANVTL
jgi:hypothetical protein